MSDKNIQVITNTDISVSDMEKVNQFIEDGLPGISSIDESKLFKMFDLYIGGSTYWQISNSLGIKRNLILYMSHKYKWFDAKKEYLDELEDMQKGRIINSKLVSNDFLLLLSQAYQKRISKKLHKYLATDDPSHMDEIDLKEVGQLIKTIEMISDLNNEGKDSKGKTPAVGLNLGDGVTIERSGDNKVTITPKEKTIGDMLKKFADSRREEQKPVKTSDIKENDTKNKE